MVDHVLLLIHCTHYMPPFRDYFPWVLLTSDCTDLRVQFESRNNSKASTIYILGVGKCAGSMFIAYGKHVRLLRMRVMWVLFEGGFISSNVSETTDVGVIPGQEIIEQNGGCLNDQNTTPTPFNTSILCRVDSIH